MDNIVEAPSEIVAGATGQMKPVIKNKSYFVDDPGMAPETFLILVVMLLNSSGEFGRPG